MSASRTWMGLRQAGNSHHANNLATIAKKAGSDVVDTIVQNHNKRQNPHGDSDLSASSSNWLAHTAVLSSSDFGTDMGDFAPGGFLSDVDDEDHRGSALSVNDLPDDDLSFIFESSSSSSASASAQSTPAPSSMPIKLSNLSDVFSPGVEMEFDKLDRAADPFLDWASSSPMKQHRRAHSLSDASATATAAAATSGDQQQASPTTVFGSPSMKPLALPVVLQEQQGKKDESSESMMPRSKVKRGSLRRRVASSITEQENKPLHLSALGSSLPKRHVRAPAVTAEEAEFDKRMALASSRGDLAAIRQIKNGREKVRRAKMCNKFEELHDVVTITNQMMALTTSEVVSPDAVAAARNATAAASAAAAAKTAEVAEAAVKGTKKTKAHFEKRKPFKKADVLHNAIETIKEMQAQIELLAQRNARLEQQQQRKLQSAQ